MSWPPQRQLTRTVLRYHGGKFRIAPWIVGYMPIHKAYVEPFGGGASVLLCKPRVSCEVYNDLSDEIVNLFRVLRDPAQAADLERLLYLTPYSRTEFLASFERSDDRVEQARRTIVAASMAHGTAKVHECQAKTGFRRCSTISRTSPSLDWANYPSHIAQFVERLRGVTIECRPATDVIKFYDSPETLIYADPPYVRSTRTSLRWDGEKSYEHEMSNDDHVSLSKVLRNVSGMVMLSGYSSALYDDLYHDWQYVEKAAFADQAKPRTERLWFSPALVERMAQQTMQFEVTA